MAKSRIQLSDIAARLKVNKATVSRALNDDPRISKAVRERVQRTAQQMGYRPDPMLAALAFYRRANAAHPVTAALAWINRWPEPKKLRSFKEFDLYWRGAHDEAGRAGYRLEEFIIGGELSALRVEQILLTRNIRGVLLPPTAMWQDWSDFHWEEFCVVRFGYSIVKPGAHVVSSDQMADGMIAFENIRRRGYRRIGLVTAVTTQTRFTGGYLLGQLRAENDPRLPPLVLTHGRDDQRRFAAWLKKNTPDAILTDLYFLRPMLREAGYRVPQDIGLAATSVLDGDADAGIYQQSEEIGKAAVQLLISLIHHNERGIPEISREVLIVGRWQDGSTLPPR
jgi:DNA-binding LacI/PurR family transcriptional regulator